MTRYPLVLKNANILDVFGGGFFRSDIAVADGRIACLGELSGDKEVDLAGKYVVPGLINAHCHIESSLASPADYCREELRSGTTAAVADPHEIANAAGVPGIEYMLGATEGIPFDCFFMLPSCVPATPFEHAAAVLNAADLVPFKSHARVLGLGEMMNVPGVLGGAPDVMEKLREFSDMVIDGHAPGASGEALSLYAAAGPSTDHESVTWAEAREKLRNGLAIYAREGSASKNLTEIISGALADGVDLSRMAFCTDDKHLSDVRREGTIIHCVRMAIALGMKPDAAYRLASYNAARIYGLKHRGAVAPGYIADLVVLDSLEDGVIDSVYKDGVLRVRGVEVLDWPDIRTDASGVLGSVRLAPLCEASFALPERDSYSVVGVIPGQIVTKRIDLTRGEVNRGLADGSLRLLAVVERHHATGNVGVGLVSGYGAIEGAVATTFAHDSHNLIIVGSSARDMLAAATEVASIGGGRAVVRDGKVVSSLPLELGGLMSLLPPDELITRVERIDADARSLGVADGVDAFGCLSFLALPVIPELRVTDMGVFDVNKFEFVK